MTYFNRVINSSVFLCFIDASKAFDRVNMLVLQGRTLTHTHTHTHSRTRTLSHTHTHTKTHAHTQRHTRTHTHTHTHTVSVKAVELFSLSLLCVMDVMGCIVFLNQDFPTVPIESLSLIKHQLIRSELCVQ